MNASPIPQAIFDSIEKVLRYLVPGFLFVFLVKISFLEKTLSTFSPNITKTEFYILSPVFGLAIYTVHRVFFWIFDFGFRMYKKLTLSESLECQANIKKIKPDLSDILYYRWAIIHFGLILSELVFIFSLKPNKGTLMSEYSVWLRCFSIGFFLLCFVFYGYLELNNLELFEKYKENVL